MITLEQARELSRLINNYTEAAIALREKWKQAEFDKAKSEMTKYLSGLVDKTGCGY